MNAPTDLASLAAAGICLYTLDQTHERRPEGPGRGQGRRLELDAGKSQPNWIFESLGVHKRAGIASRLVVYKSRENNVQNMDLISGSLKTRGLTFQGRYSNIILNSM